MPTRKTTAPAGAVRSTSLADTHVIRAAHVDMLAQVLDDFSDALALVETAQEALEAAEIAGAHLATLHHGIADLRLARKGLDLAILGIQRGVK
jgi:hypothetical protein